MNISAFLSTHEGALRFSVAAGLFAILAVTEALKPRRERVQTRTKRWFTNFIIIGLDSLLVRLLFPAAAVGVALWAQTLGYGLFNAVEAPLWLAILASFIVLDLAVWASHVASHKVPLFWRFHRMHHADRDIDVTTGVRFHPVEIIASMGWKAVVVIALGAPPEAVIIFEIVLNGTAMFNHSNTKLPLAVDRVLRLVLVTPDMHRVHHSAKGNETDSNYGFNLPWWDRMFGTYIDQPEAGHEGMTIGLNRWQDERPAQITWALLVPFRK
jgi:sterol desaturase/sphingolipid hydroxylase (fatty acid hydroxylase superfamily)